MKRILALVCFLLLGMGVAAAQTNLNGAGATFPYPIYSKWFNEYHKQHPDVQINYQSIGSGGGIRQVLNGTVDFGASDGPMSDEQLAQYKGPGKLFHIPTVLGAVVPAYNVAGVGDYSGDRTADVLWRNNTNGDIGYYQVSGGSHTWHDLGLSGTAYQVAQTPLS